MNMCEWPTGCTERAKVTHTHTHGHEYQKRLRMKTNNNERNPAFLLTVSFSAGDHTPSLWRTRRRDTPLEASSLAGWHLFHEMGQPSFAWVVHSPSERTNHFSGCELKTGKKNLMIFWHFSSGNCGTSGSYVWVGGLAWIWIWGVKHAFCWHWGRGVFSWCHPPSVCYICRNHLWLMDTIVTWTA